MTIHQKQFFYKNIFPQGGIFNQTKLISTFTFIIHLCVILTIFIQPSLSASNLSSVENYSNLIISERVFEKTDYHKVIIYTLIMGLQRSINRRTEFLQLKINQSVDAKYQTKLFLKNQKSTKIFKQELESICKRSSYLNYSWAKQLYTILHESSDKLYKEYRSVLKQNCIREGHQQKTFCPAQIRNLFMDTFTNQYGGLNTPLTPTQLSSVYEECKAYQMVMTWLHKLVSLEDKEKQQKLEIDEREWYNFEEKPIYQILARLSQLTYVNRFRKCPQFFSENIKKSEAHPLNKQLLEMLKALRQKLTFNQREYIIQAIQSILQNESPELISESIKQIRLYMSDPEIFSHLMVIREVGRVNIDFLWKIFCEEDYKLLFE